MHDPPVGAMRMPHCMPAGIPGAARNAGVVALFNETGMKWPAVPVGGVWVGVVRRLYYYTIILLRYVQRARDELARRPWGWWWGVWGCPKVILLYYYESIIL